MRSRAGTSQSGKTLRNYSCEEKGSDVNDVPQANDTPDAKAAGVELPAVGAADAEPEGGKPKLEKFAYSCEQVLLGLSC